MTLTRDELRHLLALMSALQTVCIDEDVRVESAVVWLGEKIAGSLTVDADKAEWWHE